MWQKEQVIEEFQKRGKRITGQREMLLEVLLEGNWTSCKDVYYEARKGTLSWGWRLFTGRSTPWRK